MLNKSIRVLNFDDSLTKQTNLLSTYSSEIINLKDMGPAARFWLNSKDRKRVEERLAGSSKSSVTFLGSGDFHHISSILISAFKGPISVIAFDLHPDWTVVGPRLSCGAWVSETLKNKNILKCILAGSSIDDLSGISIEAGDLGSLKDDRVEVYPYQGRSSRVFLRNVPENISIGAKRGICVTRISWNELNNKNLTEFFSHIINRLPSREVYVSIDKDCLKKEYALTNWQEGRMELGDLLLLLKMLKERCDIAGLDITGDHSEISMKGVFKNIISRFDHPKGYSAKGVDGSFITAVNEKTNLKILETLSS